MLVQAFTSVTDLASGLETHHAGCWAWRAAHGEACMLMRETPHTVSATLAIDHYLGRSLRTTENANETHIYNEHKYNR